MAGRKFSSRKLYNLECVLPYVRERYTFLNIFINEKKIQGSTSPQPVRSAQTLIVFPVLFCLHFFQLCFVRRNLLESSLNLMTKFLVALRDCNQISVYGLVFFHCFDQWTVLYEPIFLGMDQNCLQLMSGRLHESSSTCGTAARYTQRDCDSLLFCPNTLAASFFSCVHLHSQIWFSQAQTQEPIDTKNQWLIFGSVTVCLYFQMFWFPVWKCKILWHVSINIFLHMDKARPHVRKSALLLLFLLGWRRAQRCVSCLP